MKKLLITTALAGAMIGGSAIAQTTISGELRVGYKAHSNKDSYDSNRGFGSEQQINVQTKGKTNIGWDYAAGFSLENDGEATVQTGTLFNENVYFDFIKGNTTISISKDHIQRSDTARSNGVLFGYDPADVVLGIAPIANESTLMFQQNRGAAPGQHFGLAVIQTIPAFGNVSVLYVPENGQQPGSSESNLSAQSEAESAYEVGFVGDVGVKGLNVHLFKHEEKKRMGQTKKRQGENYGIKYTVGQITAGINRIEHNGANTALSQTADIKEMHYGLAYAVTPNFTIGANYYKAEGNNKSEEAKIKVLQMGYNLGPVALVAGVAKAENVDGTNDDAADLDRTGFVRLIGAF